MKNKRSSKHDRFKQSHTLFLETGLIFALLFMITAMNINLETKPPEPPEPKKPDVINVEPPINTKKIEIPPPPARPVVPVEVIDDTPIEDEIIDFGLDDFEEEPIPSIPPDPDRQQEAVPFYEVQNKPVMIGGAAELHRHIKYPELAQKIGIEGRVFIQFVINEKGEILNPKVIRGIGGGCDEAALEALKKVKFKPGKQRGRPVPVKMSIAIQFRLEN